MGIIGDASGSSLAWKMVVIWLDKRRWGPPPRLEQTGAEEPRAGGINEQAVLKGTGFCNADEWSLQSRDGRREHKGKRGGGRKSGVKWAQREQQWKKALICTSDFCKLVYHVSSATVPHVPPHSTVCMPLLDPNPFFFVCCQIFPCFLRAKRFYHLRWFLYSRFDGSHLSRIACLTWFYGLFFPSSDWMLRLRVKSQYLLLSIKLDWAAVVLKVIRRRKHREIYAHKKHELTWGPLSPL